MNGYHFNEVTGKSGVCKARSKCPLGGEAVHFKTKNEMNNYVEVYERSRHSTFNTNSKINGRGSLRNEVKVILKNKGIQITNGGVSKIKLNDVGEEYIHVNSTFRNRVLIHSYNGAAVQLQEGEDYNGENKMDIIRETVEALKGEGEVKVYITVNKGDSIDSDFTILNNRGAPIFNNSMRIKSVLEEAEKIRSVKKLENKYPDRIIIATDGSVSVGNKSFNTYGYLTTDGRFNVDRVRADKKRGTDSFSAELNALKIAVGDNRGSKIAVIMDSDEVYSIVNEAEDGGRRLSAEDEEFVEEIRGKIKSGEIVTEVVKSHSQNYFNNTVDLLLRSTFSYSEENFSSVETEEALQNFVDKNAVWLKPQALYVPLEMDATPPPLK